MCIYSIHKQALFVLLMLLFIKHLTCVCQCETDFYSILVWYSEITITVCCLLFIYSIRFQFQSTKSLTYGNKQYVDQFKIKQDFTAQIHSWTCLSRILIDQKLKVFIKIRICCSYALLPDNALKIHFI